MKARISTRILRRFSVLALLAVFLAVPFFSMPAQSAAQTHNEQVAEDFILTLADKAIASLTAPNTPRNERVKRFRALFNEYFAVRGIGKWVLGRHWKKASEAQKKEYLHLFEDLMVVSYVERFSRYAGETLKVVKTLPHKNKNITTVYAELTQPGGASKIRMEWRVTTKGEKIKITDVTVEGISMGSTLKSDFGSIIRREGNSVEGLIVALREKTTSLKVSTN